jgi:aspartate aminotransferase
MAKSKIDELQINLNLNVRGLVTSATLAINEKCAKLKSEGKPVYRFGLGQSPFPVPESVVQTLKDNAFQKDYQPVRGLYPLREAVANFLSVTQKVDSSPRNIIIGPGSKELIFLLQLVYYGDLIIPTPSWVSYSPQARIIGRHVHWVPTKKEENYRLSPEKLDMICRTDPKKPRVVILNYPANPTGSTYSIERLKELAAVARQYRVILVSDEIYGLLHYNNQHVSIARYYPEGTIISTGLSKWCGAGGWRLGAFSFPENLYWLRDAISTVASETFTSTSAPIQYAAVTAFNGGSWMDEYLYHARRVLREIYKFISNKFDKLNISYPTVHGAFYIFPDFEFYREKLKSKDIYTSVELCEKLLEDTGFAMLPGTDFGRQPEELTARIAFVDFNGAEALGASRKNNGTRLLDGDFVINHCGNISVAFEKLEQWLGDL